MIGMSFRGVLASAVVAGTSIFGISAVEASTVTQLIHFDDANNGKKTYVTADGNFTFDPTNLQSGNCADSTEASGNGSCLHEVKNGTVTTLVRNLDTFAAATAYDKDTSETSDRNPGNIPEFKLDSFYLEYTGKGADPNYFEIQGYDEDGIALGDWVKFQLGNAYSNVSYYTTGLDTGTDLLTFDSPYIFDMTGITQFQSMDLAKVTWRASDSANLRLDCVVTSFNGSTSEPLSGFSKGCGVSDGGGGGEFEVPVPASLPLMVTALGVFGFMRRKARKSA